MSKASNETDSSERDTCTPNTASLVEEPERCNPLEAPSDDGRASAQTCPGLAKSNSMIMSANVGIGWADDHVPASPSGEHGRKISRAMTFSTSKDTKGLLSEFLENQLKLLQAALEEGRFFDANGLIVDFMQRRQSVPKELVNPFMSSGYSQELSRFDRIRNTLMACVDELTCDFGSGPKMMVVSEPKKKKEKKEERGLTVATVMPTNKETYRVWTKQSTTISNGHATKRNGCVVRIAGVVSAPLLNVVACAAELGVTTSEEDGGKLKIDHARSQGMKRSSRWTVKMPWPYQQRQVSIQSQFFVQPEENGYVLEAGSSNFEEGDPANSSTEQAPDSTVIPAEVRHLTRFFQPVGPGATFVVQVMDLDLKLTGCGGDGLQRAVTRKIAARAYSSLVWQTRQSRSFGEIYKKAQEITTPKQAKEGSELYLRTYALARAHSDRVRAPGRMERRRSSIELCETGWIQDEQERRERFGSWINDHPSKDTVKQIAEGDDVAS